MDEFESRALEAAKKRKGLKIDPLPMDELMALEFEAGAKWARAELQAVHDELLEQRNNWIKEAERLKSELVDMRKLKAELERANAENEKHRWRMVGAQVDPTPDEAYQKLQLLAESYRGLLGEILEYFDKSLEADGGGQYRLRTSDAFERARAALDGGET